MHRFDQTTDVMAKYLTECFVHLRPSSLASQKLFEKLTVRQVVRVSFGYA